MPLGEADPRIKTAFFSVDIIFWILFICSTIQMTRTMKSYRVWTLQKSAYLLLFSITGIRAGFLYFIAASKLCDAASGALDLKCPASERELFYILDQLPSPLLFSLSSLLVLFWGEIYCHSTNQSELLKNTIKPAIKALNVFVYVFQILLWFMYGTIWTKERHYVTKTYAMVTAISFFLMSIGFIAFGRLAYLELRQVPVELHIRYRKLNEVAVVTTIWTTCFSFRSGLLLWIALQDKQFHRHSSWAWIAVYYGVLEAIPCIVVLYLFRVIPKTRTAPMSVALGGISDDAQSKHAGHLYKSLLEED